MKECKGCNNKYDLKKSGRYCPKCGIDYWDGVCGFSKQLNKKELMINNEKFRKMNLVKIMLCFFLFINIGTAQVYYDEIAPADTSGFILVSKTDGVFDTIPLLFEGRNDSICIVGGACIGILPVGVESYSIIYNTSTQSFDISSISDGIPFDTSFRFYPPINEITSLPPILLLEEVTSEPWEPSTKVLNTIRYDNPIGVGIVNDSIINFKISYIDYDLLFSDTIVHDSIDININDLDSDPTNEIQDTSEILALQEFVENHSIKTYTETDPIYIAWDKDYDDITNTPTLAELNYWTQDVTDLYYNSGDVGIGLTNPAHTLDVYGKMNLTNAQSNVLISGGNDTGTGTANVAIGKDTYKTFTTGLKNVAIGSQALELNTTGQNNIALGYQALEANTTGNYNVAVGSRVLQNANSNYNTGIGYLAGLSATGTSNVTIGYAAGQNAVSNNTALGYQSGRNTVSGGVYIGYKSGYSETTDNKLYIENSAGTTPLIWGDFSTNDLKFWLL